MRRAVILGIVSALLALAGSTFVGGMFGLLFAQAQAFGIEWEAIFTDDRIPASATQWAYLVMVVMVLGIVGAVICGRVVLLGLGVRNPMRTLRGPVIVLVAGGLLTVGFTFPLWFVLVAAGLAWGMITIYDEARPRGTSALDGLEPIVAADEMTVERSRLTGRPKKRRPSAGGGGDLADWQ